MLLLLLLLCSHHSHYLFHYYYCCCYCFLRLAGLGWPRPRPLRFFRLYGRYLLMLLFWSTREDAVRFDARYVRCFLGRLC